MSEKPSACAIIVAAGMGRRMGGRPKALMDLGDGQTMLEHVLENISGVDGIESIIVACVPGKTTEFKQIAGDRFRDIVFVDGDDERSGSVEKAWTSVGKGVDLVLIHDAARPYAQKEMISRVMTRAMMEGAAIPVIPLTDTVKVVDAEKILFTPDRNSMRSVQTPQCFRRELYDAAMSSWIKDGRPRITDDASLIERIGIAVSVVDGDRGNIKITYPEDITGSLQVVDMGSNFRVGTGYDLHRIVTGRPLIIGGVRFNENFGLLGHSDADVLAHAVCDSILGAAGMGDIGMHFPDTDPKWKGADSILLLSKVAEEIKSAGFNVINIDCTVVCEKPKIAPSAEKMKKILATAIGIKPGNMSVKGKTNEGLGPEGRGEAISAHAVALLIKK